MRIVFIAKHYFPHVGGVEKHLLEINKRLVKKGHKITVVCEQIEGTKLFERVEGIEVYRIPYPKKKIVGLLTIWAWFWKKRRIIKEADVVHIHDVFIWYLPMRFLSSKPTFITFHGWEGIYPIPFKNVLYKRLAAYLTTANICVGVYIEKWYGIRADEVIYGAVEERVNIQKPKLNSLRILYLGRLDKDTGLNIYLKAFKILKSRVNLIKFEFLGDGELREECAKLGIVHGFQKDIWPYIEDARFICTSGYLSMLEGMVSKRLVFSTSENPIKQDILALSPFEQNTIHTKTPEDLARKIEFFLRNLSQEEKMRDKAFSWATGQTWEKVVEIYTALWNKKLQKN